MMNHLRSQGPDLGVFEPEFPDEKRPRGDIYDGACESLVKWRVGVAEALQPFSVTKSFGEGLAETEECVFGCVVVIDYFQLMKKK